ncbi:hypothetical protein Pint_30924 [Pistacia integerrima]|uniref:Uncharacterized protein n=1 Tax=Pistacia integerrima TaxID=434235 RepID=A0ACC0XR14_9ROSI|nr:hypothetical protein Pint_30924 [Pistacia integerrima]
MEILPLKQTNHPSFHYSRAVRLQPLSSAGAGPMHNRPLQDFCVAVDDPLHGVFVNGKFCKDPKLPKAGDFYFSVKMSGDTNNPVGSNVSAVNVDQIPGLHITNVTLVILSCFEDIIKKMGSVGSRKILKRD